MATFYNIMLYGGLALAIIFAIVAVILFFVLKIPKAIGDVTGSTARKQIQEIREKGYESVQGGGASKKDAIKSHTSKISVRDVQSSADPAEKGKANYDKAIADLKSQEEGSRPTDVLLESIGETETDVLTGESESATDILMDDGESSTDILTNDVEEEATDVLRDGLDDEEATDVLRESYDDASTDILTAGASDDESTDVLAQTVADTFKMIKDIVVVHSNESI